MPKSNPSLPHKVEPRNHYYSSDARPAIAVWSNTKHFNFELEVSLAHPWCSNVISNAWLDGAAALRCEEEKYKQEKLPGGSFPDLIPLVFEDYGHWEIKAEKRLHKISQQSGNEDGKINSANLSRRTGGDIFQSLYTM